MWTELRQAIQDKGYSVDPNGPVTWTRLLEALNPLVAKERKWAKEVLIATGLLVEPQSLEGVSPWNIYAAYKLQDEGYVSIKGIEISITDKGKKLLNNEL